jgi:hypothetical protein
MNFVFLSLGDYLFIQIKLQMINYINIIKRPKLIPKESNSSIIIIPKTLPYVRKRTKWTETENSKLLQLVQKNGENWDLISKELDHNFSSLQCSNHWKLSVNPNIKKGIRIYSKNIRSMVKRRK